ncbi:hypothetical protein H2200_009791 [Cladophialophora chaetospira]|uniref:Zn(2)-C6 fungal-type domain-containing protein n=1 Tax=Cladophialophora chaetospira TaxID=386627 RepID=A0AA38X3F2_9EURO|nr:hypothetical protein H2200_009791 [Cladophialophora chaetospira]
MSATNPPSINTSNSGSTRVLDVLPLRNSCEACASSKLRCSKEKPTCNRCAKRGVNCEYFITKRAGRKPGSRSSINRGSSSSNIERPGPAERTQSFDGALSESSDKLNEDLIMLDQSLPTTFMELDTFSDACFATNNIDFDFFNAADLLSTYVEGSGNSSDSSIRSNSTGATGFDKQGNFSITTLGLDGAIPEVSMPLPETDLGNWRSPLPELESTEQRCSCLAEALGTITRLSHLSSTVCTTWATSGLDNVMILRTVLDVVEQNKVTINTVKGILDCSNFHDGHLLAIISFIIFKMLSLYAAVACKDPNLQNLQSGLAQPTPQLESMMSSPGPLDSYNLDRSDPQHMAGRIVLGELHRLRHLIAQLVEKLKSQTVTQEQAEGTEMQQSMDLDLEMRLPLSPVMYEQLDLDLRRRLKALSWAIVDRMTRL